MKTNLKGNIGLGAVISYLCKQFYVVSIPLNDITDYDLIYDKNNELRRVSVKYTTEKTDKGEFICKLTTNIYRPEGYGTKHFDPKLVEDMAIVTEMEAIYIIPSSEITNSNSITLDENKSNFLVEGNYFIDIQKRCECGQPIGGNSSNCRYCIPRFTRPTKINWPSVEEVKQLVSNLGFSGTARYLSSINENSITDNAIRKYLGRK